jgi:hypothetical protein
MIRFLLCLTALISVFALNAQVSERAIGEWDNLVPYNRGNTVAYSSEYFYWGTTLSIFRMRRDDLSTAFIAKADGLNNTDIGYLNFHEPTKTLFIAYKDGSFDLWNEDSKDAVYIPDIKQNLVITGSKSIVNVTFNGNKALLSTGFGIIQFDMQDQLFDFTLLLQEPTYGSAIWQDSILLAAESGLYSVPLIDGYNYQDINNWQQTSGNFGIPAGPIEGIVTLDGTPYILVAGSIYKYQPGGYTLFYQPEAGYAIKYITSSSLSILIGEDCIASCTADRVMSLRAGDIQPSLISGQSCVNENTWVIETPDNQRAYGDLFLGFRFNQFDLGCNSWTYDAPFTSNVNDISIGADSKVATAAGGLSDNFGGLSRNDGVQWKENGSWQYQNYINNQVMVDSIAVQDFLCVAVDPNDQSVFAGSFWGGLVHYKDGITEVYNKTNSFLQGDVGDTDRERVTDLGFDEEGNLWIMNYNAPRPIVKRNRAGEWFSYSLPFNRPIQMAVDRNGMIWFVNVGINSPGVVVFDPNGTDDASDDTYRYFGASGSQTMQGNPLCITADREGEIWVGTRDGAVRFVCNGDVDNCSSDAPQVLLDGIPAVLLDDQEVRSVVSDGANRKWFGTTSGIFVISSNGSSQEAFYNIDNSPLLDNYITALAVDPENGDVYIGTARGLSVLRSEAVAGKAFNRSDAYAFPNPVKPGYDGDIAINGLAEDANVKITDTSGRLIWEGTALGGQAVWNGMDYTGREAATGVYLVFATSSISFGSPDKLVTKIAIVRD